MSLLGPEPNDKRQAEFILGLVSKTYAHQLQPFFRGVVVSSTPASGLGYLVKVQRPEGTAPDGMEYLCLIPGYVPAAGDVVDCMWRDARTGYVFAVLQANVGFPYKVRATATIFQSIANNAWVQIVNMTAMDDPNRNWSTVNNNYTVPVSDDYLVAGFVEMNGAPPAAGAVGCAVYINGAQVVMGSKFSVAAGTIYPVSNISDMIPLNAGDLVDLRVAHNAGSAWSTCLSSLALRKLSS